MKYLKTIISGSGNLLLETMGNSLKERQNPEPYKYRENEFTKLCFG
jgi:hypothetical protein